MKHVFSLVLAVCLCLSLSARSEEPCALTFSSFYGGPEITLEVQDPLIVSWEAAVTDDDDASPDEPLPPGSGYTLTYIFTGLKPGTTRLTVSFHSPSTGTRRSDYAVTVDDFLHVVITPEKRLVHFHLSRSTDLPTRSYQILMLEDAYYLSRDSGPAQKIDASVVQELEEVLESCHVFSWDGFQGSDPWVLDGEMFQLEVAYSDGTTVLAAGNNDFPDGYFAAAGAMEKLLSSLPPDTSLSVSGSYQYIGSESSIVISLASDGTYTFAVNGPDGCSGGGSWSMEGPVLWLAENTGLHLYQTFLILDDFLIFVPEDSDPFPGTDVPDGGRFTKTSPQEAD